MRNHQRGALFLLPVLLLALGATVLLAPAGQPAVALAATNACKSNATATYSDISIGLTGTPTPSAATVGAGPITLGGIGLTAAVPATLLIAGYNLGLLTTGSNAIPVKGWVSIAASNTLEGARTLTFTANVDTVITDPNGIPGTGDETATPLSLNVSLPDTTFTPTGGNIAFTQGAPGSLPAIPAGQVSPGATTPAGGIYISAQVAGGLVKANFDCQVGTTIISPPGGSSGPTFTPGTASPFATATVSAAGGTTTTVGGTTGTSTTVPGTTGTTSTTTVTTPGTTVPPVPVSGAATYATSCTNSVTPDIATITFHAVGTVPSSVAQHATFALSGMHWNVVVPSAVFQTGINLGLITPGTSVAGLMDVSIDGSNTTQAIQDAPNIALSIPVNTNSLGAAIDSTVAFDLPNENWTAAGLGAIDFVLHGAHISVKIGPLSVVFNCSNSQRGAFAGTTTGAPTTTTTTTTSPPAATTTTTPRTTTTTTAPGATTTTAPGATTTTTAPPASGTAAYDTSCTNNVTTDLAVLAFNASGRVPSQVKADTAFTMDNLSWDVTVPDSVFQVGLNLGLLTPGATVTGALDLSLKGTNTAQGVQTATAIALSIPVNVDAAGKAVPSKVKFDVPNQSWTSLTGAMAFSMNGAKVSVKVGALNILFTCKVTGGGPFVSSTASGDSHITTTTTAVASGGPTAGGSGGKLVSTGPRDNLWIQLLAALVLLDLGYLTLSLLRTPRRRHV